MARVARDLELEAGGRDVARARHAVEQSLDDPSFDGCRDDVVLAVSELVTNALVHGEGTVHLRLTATEDFVRIEVSDRSAGRPHVVDAAQDATGGRGLRIVEVVSTSWGIVERDDGKTVWCEIATTGTRSG